jgi:KUP system potassium uptake protein
LKKNDAESAYWVTLTLATLGVVYGDIGTSPLYALRECFDQKRGVPATAGNIFGVVSLIFWSLLIVISIKYLVIVLRADDRGEGGILVLTALARKKNPSAGRRTLILVGLFGAALLYGDGIITPAISVLSALEGLEVATPRFEPWVIPCTVIVLAGLFIFQRAGTEKVGRVFGPVMMVWFIVIGGLGLREILHHPHILLAVSPQYAVDFFEHNGHIGFLVLGSVFLVVTGGEALYADMGHFGATPIRIGWFTVVLPALLLNYFGQGALLLDKGDAHPFFDLAPHWMLLPMVGLSTMATIIASQAVISGAFSLTRQAVQLGYLPRVRIQHTSSKEIGQIYIPAVNWILMLAAIALVLAFRRSGNLAAAYGVAVTTTMTITTILIAVVARERWNWNRGVIGLLVASLLVVDLSFFAANIIKVPDGGWFPLAVGAAVFTLMTTWRRGRAMLHNRLTRDAVSIDHLLRDLEGERVLRVPGTAVFMSRLADGIPTTLLHNLKHNKVLHQRVLLLTVTTAEQARIADDPSVEVKDLGQGVYRGVIRYGYMDDVDLPAILRTMPIPGADWDHASYFLGRENLLPTRAAGMAYWRDVLFAWMSRNATSAVQFFGLPPNQVVELGEQIAIE